MNVHMQMSTVADSRAQGFHLKSEVSRWLVRNGCYDGPDRSFVDCDEDARPFENWHNVDNEWAVFYFNHENMSRKFLEEFTSWSPVFDIEVKHKVRTESNFTLNNIYTRMGEELLWLAMQGKVDGVDFRWTVTQLSEENFTPEIKDTSILFGFQDKQLAMTFKLTFGGSRCSVL